MDYRLGCDIASPVPESEKPPGRAGSSASGTASLNRTGASVRPATQIDRPLPFGSVWASRSARRMLVIGPAAELTAWQVPTRSPFSVVDALALFDFYTFLAG